METKIKNQDQQIEVALTKEEIMYSGYIGEYLVPIITKILNNDVNVSMWEDVIFQAQKMNDKVAERIIFEFIKKGLSTDCILFNYFYRYYTKSVGIDFNNFTIDCKGDVCIGDCIVFEEDVFEGDYPDTIFKGKRLVYGIVLKDSYGKAKQQHTFTILVLKSEGVDADKLEVSSKIRRKGRNVYKNITKRIYWFDEGIRMLVLDDKHQRGNEARQKAKERKEEKERMKEKMEERLIAQLYKKQYDDDYNYE